MRYSIGSKIFGIAIVLLVFMFGVELFSTYLVRKVQNRIEAIAEYYVPLNGRVTNLDVTVLEQEIQFAHLKGLYLIEPRDMAAINRRRSLLRRGNEQVDQEVKEFLQLVRKGLDDPESKVDKIQFARLEPMVKSVEREHQQFHDLAPQLLQLLEQKRKAEFVLLAAQWRREREDYDRQAGQLRRELQKFTLKATQQAQKDESNILLANLIAAVTAGLLGLIFAGLITRSLVRPVKELVSATRQVERGELEIDLPVSTRDEIGDLAQSFNHMVSELRIKESIKDTFGKYLDPRLVSQMIESPGALETAGERREMTVLFSDIVNFTSIAELLLPAALVRLINEYFTLHAVPVQRRKGIIDKFIGDSLMAFWGPPFTNPQEHAGLACLAALEQLEQLEEFRRRLPELMGIRKGIPEFDIRVGIASGEVVVGNIGSELSKGYTVMGDTVNLASRLEGANKHYGSRFLINEAAYQQAVEQIEAREIDRVQVVGKTEPVRIYELLAATGSGESGWQAEVRTHFEGGLAEYRAQRWGEAQKLFRACLDLNPQDRPASTFLTRIEHLKQNPPPADWNGVWQFVQK